MKQQELGQMRGGPARYDGPMVSLHNPQLGVQISVSEDKAKRLLAAGVYKQGPLPTKTAAEN